MISIRKRTDDLIQLQDQPGIKEIDYYWFERDPRELTYRVAKNAVKQQALKTITNSYQDGNAHYVLFLQWAIYFSANYNSAVIHDTGK